MKETSCLNCKTYHSEREGCAPNPWEIEARKLARALEWYRANGTVSVKALNDFYKFVESQNPYGMKDHEA